MTRLLLLLAALAAFLAAFTVTLWLVGSLYRPVVRREVRDGGWRELERVDSV